MARMPHMARTPRMAPSLADYLEPTLNNSHINCVEVCEDHVSYKASLLMYQLISR